MRYKRSFLSLIALALVAAGCGGPASSQPVTPPPATPSPQAEVTPAPMLPIKVLFDDDGSRDGVAALLYLLGVPEISIRAVTMSYGEAHPAVFVQHIGRALDSLGITGIPLGAGQDSPLAGGIPFPDWLRQLSDKFWDYPVPNPEKTYPVQDAPRLLISTIQQAEAPVYIFLTGPFTNLALALRIDPSIKDNIAAVTFMGGAVYVPGNITNLIPDSTNGVAEWNILADPLAAQEVFSSGLTLYMVPLDATGQVIMRKEDIVPWRQGNAKARMAADLYEIMFNDYGFEKAEIFDLTAAVLFSRPDLCAFEPLALEVVTEPGDTLGQTFVVPGGEANVGVCLNPDADGVRQALNAVFAP